MLAVDLTAIRFPTRADTPCASEINGSLQIFMNPNAQVGGVAIAP
jgi:hypothetical protein